MPKMKTHRGFAKRFRVTGSGKIMRSKAYKSHIMTKKSQKRKRNFRHETEVAPADRRVIAWPWCRYGTSHHSSPLHGRGRYDASYGH